MAVATNITKLPEVLRSPSTIQYAQYKSRVKQASPYFKPRFTFKIEDREHTLLSKEIKNTDPLMPPYPYGQSMHFPEQNFGLYGGSVIQSGSKISKGRNKGKTLRHFFPNVRVETVRSEALDRDLKLPITARVMRTIRKCGGLDEYVTGPKPARIKELGLLGWKLRWLVMTSPTYRAKYEVEMKELRLPQHHSLHGTFEDAWNDETARTKMIEQQDAAWEDVRGAAERFEKHAERYWSESGEKEQYDLNKLDSLYRSPSSLGLPTQLYEQEAVVARRRREERRAEEFRSRGSDVVEGGLKAGDIPQEIEDQIDSLTRSIPAQDLGIDPAEDDPQSMERRVEVIKDMMRDRVPQIQDELVQAKAAREAEPSPEVAILQTAQEHVAKIDEQYVEQNAEQHLEDVRGQMEKDAEFDARNDEEAVERKGDDKPPSTRS